MKFNLLKLWAALALFVLVISCDNDSEGDKNGVVPSENHPDDTSVDNGDGTTTNTLAGVNFTTIHKDFSSEPVVTEAKTVSATLEDTYSFSADISYFKIYRDTLIGVLQISNFDNKLLIHSLADNMQLSLHSSDYYVGGFDFNGAILTSEGATDINFYEVDHGTIGNHFFQIPNFKSTKTNADCFLDEDNVYVANGEAIWYFKIYDSKTVGKLVDIPAWSIVRYAVDENNLYCVVAESSGDSYLTIYNKDSLTEEDKVEYPGKFIEGLSVDANYIYLSDRIGETVNVVNKHTMNPSGTLNIAGVRVIDVVGNNLYAAIDGTAEVKKFSLVFN